MKQRIPNSHSLERAQSFQERGHDLVELVARLVANVINRGGQIEEQVDGLDESGGQRGLASRLHNSVVVAEIAQLFHH